MIAIATFLTLCALLRLAGDTPCGRFLHRVMVELPAASVDRIKCGQILMTVVLALLVGLIGWYGHADGVRLVTMAAPDVAAWLTSFEVSAYLDVLAALAAGSALARSRAARSYLASRLKRLIRRPTKRHARPRCSRAHTIATAANDDEDGTGLGLAS